MLCKEVLRLIEKSDKVGVTGMYFHVTNGVEMWLITYRWRL